MPHSAVSTRALRRVLTGTVASLVVSLAFQSLANTNTFSISGTSTWNNSANWSLGHVPSATDGLFFNSATTTNNQLDSDYTAQTLSFDTGSASFNIDANSSGATTRTLTLTGGTNANGGTDLISTSANTTGTITVGGTAGVGTVTVAFGSTTGTINVAHAAAKIVFGSSSTITGSNGLTKSGAGTLSLAGTNSYTGTTTVSGGTLSVSTPLQSTVYALTGGTLKLLASNLLPSTSAVTLTGGTLDIGSSSHTVASVSLQSGSITGTTGTLTSTNAYDVQSGTISAILAGNSSPTGLTKSTGGTVTLSGANTYTGFTGIMGGILSVTKLTDSGIASNIGAGTGFTLNGGTLQYIGAGDFTNRTVRLGMNGGTLDASGTGEIDFTNTGSVLIIGTTARMLTLTGTGSGILESAIPDAATGGGQTSLTKNGPGTWMLTGANTYTGVTTVNAGTLSVSLGVVGSGGGNGDSIGKSSNAAANLVLGDGSALTGGGTTDRLFTLNGSATIKGTVDFTNNTGAIALSGVNTARTLTFTGINGDLAFFAPALGDNGTGPTSLTVTGGLNLEFTGAKSYSGDTTIDTGALLILGTNFLSPASRVNILNGATLDLGSFNNAVNGITMTLGSITGTGVMSSSSTFNLANGSVSVGLSGTGGLIKSTNAMVGLSGTCTYTGTTEIDAGDLLVFGSLPGNSTVNILAGATLQMTRSNTATQGVDFGTLTGGGVFRQAGTGTMIINRANPFTGEVRVSGGKVVVTGSLDGTAAVNVENAAVLSGSGSITSANGGAVTVKNGGTLAPDSGTTSGLTINAVVSGTASLNLQSGSTLQLAITNGLGGSHGAPSLNDYSKLTLGTNVTATLSGLIATTVTGTVNNGDVYVIVFSNTAVNGMFSNATTAAPGSNGSTFTFNSGGQQWEINYAWTGSTPMNGMDFNNFAQVTGGTNVALLAVPEPGSLTSLLSGVTMLLGWRRARRA